jgi:chromosome segregation ATPase
MEHINLKAKIMDEDKKHELTEQLKVLENEIFDAKVELKTINHKLEYAYSYEDELTQRQVAAKEKTESLRNAFFVKSGEINNLYHRMKNIFDVFTGNFYRD